MYTGTCSTVAMLRPSPAEGVATCEKFCANCSLPGLSLSVRADSEDRFPNSDGSEPVRLKSLSSKTATDWVKASVQPPARRVGVVGQQFTPYLQLRYLTRTLWCIVCVAG